MSEGRPLRDLLVQVLATVMIPVTVAGTGLYYTRWQQNLNDLKTMIDLVSDQTPEKRKYGVAMFEYLLKNDKVPVEFVAAQLAYANSSTDRELLPLMEQALLKASAENAKVADMFRLALERMPSRMFVHALNENQRACIRFLMTKVPDTERSNLTLPGYSRATWAGMRHELRVFRETDLARHDLPQCRPAAGNGRPLGQRRHRQQGQAQHLRNVAGKTGSSSLVPEGVNLTQQKASV
jgi:hypothetical protein